MITAQTQRQTSTNARSKQASEQEKHLTLRRQSREKRAHTRVQEDQTTRRSLVHGDLLIIRTHLQPSILQRFIHFLFDAPDLTHSDLLPATIFTPPVGQGFFSFLFFSFLAKCFSQCRKFTFFEFFSAKFRKKFNSPDSILNSSRYPKLYLRKLDFFFTYIFSYRQIWLNHLKMIATSAV